MSGVGTGTIEVDEFLPRPPRVVWGALTDSRRLAQWLAPNTLVAEVGHEFTFDMGRWGTTHGVVLEHRGFDLDHPVARQAYDGMGQGWRSGVMAPLHHHLQAPTAQRA